MAKQTINIGTAPNDGTGTPLRTAFDYCNQNFTELYTATGPSGNNIVVPGTATITGDLTVDTSTLKVDSANNRVGIGTATPDNQLSVRAASVAVIDVRGGVGGAGALQISGNGTTLGTTSFDLIQNSLGAIVYQRDANPLFFNVNGSERYAISSAGVATWSNVGGVAGTAMTLNSTGLGVGVTPSAWNSSYKAIQFGSGGAVSGHTSSSLPWFVASSNAFINSAGDWKYINNGYATRYLARGDDGTQSWSTSASGSAGGTITFTQAMTLDASGNLLVGTTSNAPAGTQSQFVNEWSGGAKWGSTFNQTVSSATAYTHIAFCTNGTVRGSIDANNTTITYGTVSDYRLKENVQPISNALTRIAALKPSTYKWKDSGTDGEGFIAHELAAVVPLAVVGQKDAVNEDGSIKAQQIDLSKVVPILVAAIKELAAEVNALKNA
jgi:hypothetical protein